MLIESEYVIDKGVQHRQLNGIDYGNLLKAQSTPYTIQSILIYISKSESKEEKKSSNHKIDNVTVKSNKKKATKGRPPQKNNNKTKQNETRSRSYRRSKR